jgi:hypothetical protein
MGASVGTFYGAFAENHVYLTVHSSDDYAGPVNATANVNGQTGTINGMQNIGANSTTIMLSGMVGGNTESWALTTSDFTILNGTRSFVGASGISYSQQVGLGRIG